MPRQARLILPGVAVHLMQRGNNRNACFREGSDYLVYLMHLRELAQKLACQVHAYCLMTNHVHLLVTPPTSEACTDLMRNLGQRYVQYFNRHHDRTGTLWEGRFRSCITESARYVLACYRYIEMNPVRAGMVAAACQHPWSSHAGNSGLKTDKLLTPHPEFWALGSTIEGRQKAYAQLFELGDEIALDEIRKATSGGYPLASERLKASLNVEDRRLAPRKPGPPPEAG
jgi:putative transposase